jgi:hypothetical protein
MTTQAEGAKQLVDRARAGDQNAMAILQKVGENARARDPKAQEGARHVLAYAQKNPVRSAYDPRASQALGILKEPSNPDEAILDVLVALPDLPDSSGAISAACVILSRGRPWNKARVHGLDSLLTPPAKEPFRYAFDHALDPEALASARAQCDPELFGYLCAGHVVGLARKLQLMRLPHIPLAALCMGIGWELGGNPRAPMGRDA